MSRQLLRFELEVYNLGCRVSHPQRGRRQATGLPCDSLYETIRFEM